MAKIKQEKNKKATEKTLHLLLILIWFVKACPLLRCSQLIMLLMAYFPFLLLKFESCSTRYRYLVAFCSSGFIIKLISCLTKFMDLQIFLLTHEVIKVGKKQSASA